MRLSTIRTPSATGSAPPDRPVPDPRATKGMPRRAQSATVSMTWRRVSAGTTIAGVARKLARPSHSYVRRADRSVSTREAPTVARSSSARAALDRGAGTSPRGGHARRW